MTVLHRSCARFPTHQRQEGGQRGIQHVFHYLVDFIVVTRPASPNCREAIGILNEACAYLNVPIADHKCDGPTTCLTFLEIEVDTIAGQLCLPTDKLHSLQILLAEWGDRKACTRRELESLAGVLNHASKLCVRDGHFYVAC